MEIVTPPGIEARYGHKLTAAGQRDWAGDRDHQTETCTGAGPNVIAAVATRPAPEQDITAVEDIHAALAGRGFTPCEHPAGGGYLPPDAIHRAALQWGITLAGPAGDDPRGRPGFTKEDFRTGWQARTVTCPRAVTSLPWRPAADDGRPRLPVLFPRTACRECPVRLQCTGNLDGKGRHITVLPRPQQEIQTRARAEHDSAQCGRVMRCGLGARRPCLRSFMPMACGTAAITGWPRPTSSTS
jgi:Transposase DDE domain